MWLPIQAKVNFENVGKIFRPDASNVIQLMLSNVMLCLSNWMMMMMMMMIVLVVVHSDS